MSDLAERVVRQYAAPDLAATVRAALAAAGKHAPTPDDLAPFDAFHVRGRAATAELAERLPLAGLRVLDLGSGLGGTARFLAHTHGCDVTGVDLNDTYCAVATELSDLVGLARRTRFHRGSATELPFEDGAFEVVWTEHVQMNIPDKDAFYGEAARVLQPGGRMVFHDIFGGDGPLRWPLPWADGPELSFLVRPEQARRAMEAAGFEVEQWEETSARSVAFFDTVLGRIRTEGPPVLGLHLLMGAAALPKLDNLLENLRAGAVTTVQGVLRSPA